MQFWNTFENLSPIKAFVLLAFVGFVIYVNAIFHPFVHDDLVFIVHNPNIHQWGDIGSYFFKTIFPIENREIVSHYYRPVLEIFYRLQYQLFYGNPHGFHLFNILIHIGNAWLVYALIRRWWPQLQGWALGLSLLFLMHPIQTEAVACVSGISNLIFSMFVLLSLYAFRPGFGWGVLCVISFALGLWSKEQTLVLPMIVALVHVCVDKHKFISLFKNATFWGLIIVALAYVMVRHHLFPGTLASLMDNPGELYLRLMAIPNSLMMYLRLCLMPTDLHYYRSIDILASPVWGWIGLTSLIVLWAVWFKRSHNDDRYLIAFGCLWFIGHLLPVLNIVPLINEYSFILTAEHFLYLPMLGVMILLAVIVKQVFRPAWGKMAAIVWISLLLILGLSTMTQNTIWASEIHLFKRTLQYQPHLGRVHILMAKAYMMNNQVSEAIVHYAYALQRMQTYAQKSQDERANNIYLSFQKGIHFDMAQAHFALGDLSKANWHYEQAAQLNAKFLDHVESSLYNNWAMVAFTEGDYTRAIELLEKGIKMDPTNRQLINNLNVTYQAQEDHRK